VARAKQTDRAEARRRYRQATSQEVDAEELDLEPAEAAPQAGRSQAATRATTAQPKRDQPAPRPGIGYAFRAAYHPARVREDLAALPKLLRHWAFLLPVGMIVGGGLVASTFWFYTGGQLAAQLLLFPGSGFGLPQLVAGFFAPRASYMLGFLVSLVQGVAWMIFILRPGSPVGALTPDVVQSMLVSSFLAGPLSGMLFAAAAAWYRRFLSLSSPRRAAEARQQQAREQAREQARAAKANASRRPSGR
jgi:hypothetical protein